MFCCIPSPVPENPSPQAIKLFRIIKWLVIIQVMLGIFNMFVDIWSGLLLLIGASILYMITCSRNWCTCVFYIVLCMMDIMTCIMLVGDYFCDHSKIEGDHGVMVFFSMIKFPFYAISIFYTFLSYRELKGLFIEVTEGGGMGMSQLNMPVQAWQNARDPPPPRAPEQQPFQGTGYRLG